MNTSTHIPRDPDSAIRRGLLWWFQGPGNAHVSLNLAVDFTTARAYLQDLADQDGPKVSVQHLLCAAVARTLNAFPLANAQIIGNRIRMRDRVGIAMPVNLLGHPGGARRELGLMVVEDAHTLSLRDIAGRSRKTVDAERQGDSSNAIVRLFVRAAEAAPQPVFFRIMDTYERVRRLPGVQDLFFRAAPVTSLLSNVGAAIGPQDGLLFRGASLSVPPRLGHVGTVWGVSTVQDEIVAIDGVPQVRPMLPVVLIFDHRLVDGVAAGKVALHFARILQDPASAFGADGMRLPGGG